MLRLCDSIYLILHEIHNNIATKNSVHLALLELPITQSICGESSHHVRAPAHDDASKNGLGLYLAYLTRCHIVAEYPTGPVGLILHEACSSV